MRKGSHPSKEQLLRLSAAHLAPAVRQIQVKKAHEQWKKPEVRARMIHAQKEAWKNPAIRRRRIEGIIKSWKKTARIDAGKLCGYRTLHMVRKRDTDIEVAMQKELERRKIPFKTHKIVGAVVHFVDIFIEPNIIIECDGNYWHSLPKTVRRDKQLAETYIKAGRLLLRYTENEIKANVDGCVDEIEDAVSCLCK